MRTSPWNTPRAATCSRRARWRWPTSPRRCARTPRSRRRTWARDRHRADRVDCAVPAVHLAGVGDRVLVPVGPQGLRREARPGERDAAVRRRRRDLAVLAAQARLDVEALRAVRIAAPPRVALSLGAAVAGVSRSMR